MSASGVGRTLLLCLVVVLRIAPCAQAGNRVCIVLNAQELRESTAAISALEAEGVTARHVFAPGVLICDLEVGIESAVRESKLIRAILTGPTDLNSFTGLHPNSLLGLAAWNSMQHSQQVAFAAEEQVSLPPLDDCLIAPDSPVSHARLSSAYDPTPGPYQTSEYMIGTVSVAIVLPESIGGTEEWSMSRISSVVAEIVQGAEWWAARADHAPGVTFYYHAPPENLGVPCQFEPISLPSYQVSGWFTEVMGGLGYSGADYFSLIRQYVNDVRRQNGTDWGFCVFVVDSLNDVDGCFSDGRFSYAYLFGPMCVMTYDCGAWGHSRMDQVFRHEIGHIFGAGDEYCSPGYGCCDSGMYGYLHVVNGNCAKDNPNSVPCVMKDVTSNLCEYTRWHVGWRDSDGDGIWDPVDTSVVCSVGAPAADPNNSRNLTYTGFAADIPYPSPVRLSVSINKITQIEYRLNDNPWTAALPADGRFDSGHEYFRFEIKGLGAGEHDVWVRARNSVGNLSPEVRETVVVALDPTPAVGLAVEDDGRYTNDSRQLRARWSATDPESGVSDYWYAVGVSPVDSGYGYLVDWKSAGTKTSVSLNLPLQVGETYYFHAKAANGDGIWTDVVSSDGITVVASEPVGSTKQQPDGAAVILDYKLVTHSLGGGAFYVQDDNRTSGIKVVAGETAVVPEGAVRAGDRISAEGTIWTEPTGERYVAAGSCQVICRDEAMPSPLGMSAAWLGGSVFGPAARGTRNCGLSNLGLLVRVCGKVLEVGPGCFYFETGSGGANSVARVVSDFSAEVGQFVMVTGISGAEMPQGASRPARLLIASEVREVVE